MLRLQMHRARSQLVGSGSLVAMLITVKLMVN